MGDQIRASWSRSDRAVPRRIVRPLQEFLDTEVAGAALVIGMLLVALAWANSPWSDSYQRVWNSELVVHVGRWQVTDDMAGWIRDGLMSLFFLVVALEIKRELTTGELRDPHIAGLPVAAALGGMLVPAVVYLSITSGSFASAGWGMAMPTDIALALAVLALALPNAPSGLRVFLLSMAIADDLGTILVVVVAYSQSVDLASLALALALAIVMYVVARLGVRAAGVFVGLGIGMWLALHDSGVSPTLAGVIVGFVTPAVAVQRPHTVSREAHRVADATVDDPPTPDADAAQWLTLASLSQQAVSPLARAESLLHPWTSFLVVPLFALSNAGITVTGGVLRHTTSIRVLTGMVLARLLGKPIGIAAAALLLSRTKLLRRPSGIRSHHIVAAGAAAGVPLTVSLFIARMAFAGNGLLPAAEIGILLSIVLCGALGFVLLRRTAREPGSSGRSGSRL
jgi:NhaA family Na+:H+ antiporter